MGGGTGDDGRLFLKEGRGMKHCIHFFSVWGTSGVGLRALNAWTLGCDPGSLIDSVSRWGLFRPGQLRKPSSLFPPGAGQWPLSRGQRSGKSRFRSCHGWAQDQAMFQQVLPKAPFQVIHGQRAVANPCLPGLLPGPRLPAS